jgi:putative heme transporter
VRIAASRHRRGAGPSVETPPAVGAELPAGWSPAFEAPRWLRNLGLASWFALGAALAVAGLLALLAATATISRPVVAALVVAAVVSPVVAALERRGVPRALGAALVLLGLVAIGVLVVVLVVGGITSQKEAIDAYASAAADRAASWLEDAGVSGAGAASASDQARAGVPDMLSTIVHGVATGISGLTSLVFGLSFAALSLFFALKDGPSMGAWVERHMGVPRPVATTITGNTLTSIRRYFAGVTIVAAFNAVVVGLGALVLGVPLAGTIAVVTFATAYVPYVGAFLAGGLAVVVALGSEGFVTAVIMLVIVLLANGLLQNLLQPFAFGATLGLHPLVVLIVTVGAGCLVGMAGLVLAAPLTSAAVHIAADLGAGRAAAGRASDVVTPAEPVGGGPV